MVDWDGQVVSNNIDGPHEFQPQSEEKNFFEKQVVKLGEVEVTPVSISVLTVAVLALTACCCCICSWRHRKKIALEARRLSQSIRRSLGMKEDELQNDTLEQE
jgi:hypothetical protein